MSVESDIEGESPASPSPRPVASPMHPLPKPDNLPRWMRLPINPRINLEVTSCSSATRSSAGRRRRSPCTLRTGDGKYGTRRRMRFTGSAWSGAGRRTPREARQRVLDRRLREPPLPPNLCRFSRSSLFRAPGTITGTIMSYTYMSPCIFLVNGRCSLSHWWNSCTCTGTCRASSLVLASGYGYLTLCLNTKRKRKIKSSGDVSVWLKIPP